MPRGSFRLMVARQQQSYRGKEIHRTPQTILGWTRSIKTKEMHTCGKQYHDTPKTKFTPHRGYVYTEPFCTWQFCLFFRYNPRVAVFVSLFQPKTERRRALCDVPKRGAMQYVDFLHQYTEDGTTDWIHYRIAMYYPPWDMGPLRLKE